MPRADHKPVAFIYVRVSTSKQAEEGTSLDAQEAQARALAKTRGWDVGEVFRDEGVSGKDGIEQRPGLARLIRAAATRPNAVVVIYNISRLARRQKLLWSLLDDKDGFGLNVVSVTEPFDMSTPMGRAMLGMIAVWSQLQADMIGQATKDTLAELKAQGVKLGQRSIAEKNPEAHEVIARLAAQGLGYRAITAELNRLQIPTTNGKRNDKGLYEWQKTVVGREVQRLRTEKAE